MYEPPTIPETPKQSTRFILLHTRGVVGVTVGSALISIGAVLAAISLERFADLCVVGGLILLVWGCAQTPFD